jgi:phosphomethylpyrimidine synthase
MKISQDVREYAREKGIESSIALEHGMAEKAREFREKGTELYHKA